MRFRRLHEVLDCWIRDTPDQRAAIDYDGRNLSYRDLAELVDISVSVLVSAGVRAGDRVMLVFENSVAPIAMLFACSRLDAWAVPINARLTNFELAQLQDHVRPRAMIFTHGASPAAAAHASAFASARIDEAFASIHTVGNLDADPEPVFDGADEQVGILIYTTGTMGSPKGVMISHANTLHNIAVNIEIRDLRQTDNLYPAPPHTHIFGLTATLSGLAAGATVTFLPRFDPATVFERLSSGVSVLPAVPAMYARLMEHAAQTGIRKPDAPRLRYISAGGAPLDPEWKRSVEAFFGLPLQNGYGLTEATPIVTSTLYNESRTDTSVGRPVPGVEAAIVPTKGGTCDGVGEILCRGPNVMKGYYRDALATAAVIDQSGFLHTGDLGRFREDGALEIVGRSKEVINRSGFNVYPIEVEAVLNRHPAVSQSAVVGRADAVGNEDVLAFVERVEGRDVDAQLLANHAAIHLAAYKRPTHILIVDRLPAAPSGKLLKGRMIETFSEMLVK